MYVRVREVRSMAHLRAAETDESIAMKQASPFYPHCCLHPARRWSQARLLQLHAVIPPLVWTLRAGAGEAVWSSEAQTCSCTVRYQTQRTENFRFIEECVAGLTKSVAGLDFDVVPDVVRRLPPQRQLALGTIYSWQQSIAGNMQIGVCSSPAQRLRS